MEIKVNNSVDTKIKLKSSAGAKKTKYVSSTQLAEKYYSQLKKDYSQLNLKKNNMNIFTENGLTITLSPELLKKASKDPEVDKEIRKSLDDALKYNDSFKANNCTKDGRKVDSVSYFIDSSKKISCSIKLAKKVSINSEEERKTVSRDISSKFRAACKKCDADTSLFYKYLSLLNKNNFTSLDVTV